MFWYDGFERIFETYKYRIFGTSGYGKIESDIFFTGNTLGYISKNELNTKNCELFRAIVN